jgi:hypothetical protein
MYTCWGQAEASAGVIAMLRCKAIKNLRRIRGVPVQRARAPAVMHGCTTTEIYPDYPLPTASKSARHTCTLWAPGLDHLRDQGGRERK